MKNKLHQLFQFCALVFMGMMMGCSNKEVIYSEMEKFDNYEWKKGEIKTFEIPINDNRFSKEMILDLRYATGYPYDKIYMKVIEIDPQGQRTIRDVDFRIRDEQGGFIGDKALDIIDLQYILDANKTYPMHGQYTYQIEHAMPSNIQTLHYVMEIGLTLRENKPEG